MNKNEKITQEIEGREEENMKKYMLAFYFSCILPAYCEQGFS